MAHTRTSSRVRAKSVNYTVSDGTKSITKPILYCFGQGHIGQTYLFRHNDVLYETRVSLFQKIRGLDFTIGHQPAVPTSLEDALGRAIGGSEPRECFGCHTTGAVNGLELNLDRLTPRASDANRDMVQARNIWLR